MEPQKMSHFKRARLLMKAATTTLKADKELVMLPLSSMIWSTLVIIVLAVVVIANGHTDTATQSWQSNGPIPAIASALAYVLITFIATYFGAALFAGATKRFRGEDPTVKSSLAEAKTKIKPLFVYSLFMATIGLIFRTLEERLPLAGKIATYIFNAAWGIANIFSIPVIMSSSEDLTPIAATKQSVGIVKKVWGENAIAQFGYGIVALLYIVGVMLVAGAAGALMTSIGLSNSLTVIVTVLLALIGFVAIGIIFSALGAIVTAAVYYYATTGTSPEQFSTDLLKQTITTKKSRRIFSN